MAFETGSSETGERPAPVTAIAVLFLLAAAYLIALGTVMLVSPGAVSMAAGSELLGGLETWGPYMFLLAGSAGGLSIEPGESPGADRANITWS